ncbi:unnamed protein product [Mycena citricolor]|uniref:AMP-dependent synthetase/ligase domain-containing protein n=1 Tax=Mycena citricolor TaxID=2018698 RepID=A0AAD2HHX8_9AGAR|nr:unnamed protein product [Mycena citricolor]CAK5275299.1 unnamed protein product [Mycena citricolor]
MTTTHLSILECSARRFPAAVAFKVPRRSEGTSNPIWRDISYAQLLQDIQETAGHFLRIFRRDRIPAGSVVGLWISGYDYKDVVNIYGLSRAGFIPQLFSLRLPSADVILELLVKTGAQALIYEDLFESALGTWPIPIYRAAELVASGSSAVDLPSLPEAQEEAIAFYFHTSGSTSGSPKLVPCTYRWMESTIRKSAQTCAPKRETAARFDVASWGGSMCHIFQNFLFIGYLQHNACIVQPLTTPFSPSELVDMIQDQGLNRLNIFGSFAATHLRTSREDARVLKALTALDELMYTGLPLPREEEAWALSQSIKLRNVFGSTEVGALLISSGGCGPEANLLYPAEDVAYDFVPIETGNAGPHVSTTRILELVVLAQSGDCPHPSLRQSDGNFHTGDLFIEAAPGRYLSQGRDDDWIKMESSLRCNTKAIEENARASCGNLISECIVVGSARPSPVLFVEPGSEAVDQEKLKRDIIRKTRQFHARRYLHERITSTAMIVVVPKGSLPRTVTKGNIRRKAVEEIYQSVIDGIFVR